MSLLNKKLNSKGFGHLALLLVIVVAAVVVGSGVVVYSKNHKAHASSWTYVTSYGKSASQRVTASACRRLISNAYGGVYQVTVLFSWEKITPPVAYYAWATVGSSGTLASGKSGSNTASQGKALSGYIGFTASRARNDYVRVQIGGQSASMPVSQVTGSC